MPGGLALNPGTPVEHVTELGDDLDYVNVLSIDPGFAGQAFIGHATTGGAPADPAAGPRGHRDRRGHRPRDAAGRPRRRAQLFVSASSIFGAADPVAAYAELAALAAA